ncbi:MAG: carboxypeptidase-like regulatory domain-containing protein [Bacillota bacterium]
MQRHRAALAAALAAVLALGTAPGALAAQAPAPAAPLTYPGAQAVPRAVLGQVVDTDGQPLPGAEVELFRYTAGRVAVATADGEGYFRFSDLTDGVYWLRAWAPGHTAGEVPYVPGTQEPFVTLTLAPLEAVVAGRVLDARTGQPVPEAEVTLIQTGVGAVAAGTTRADGHFALSGPGGEGYALAVRARGYQPRLVDLGALAGGKETGVTVALEPATARVGGTVVTTVGGVPLASARVRVLRAGFGVVAEAFTGPDGSFDLEVPASTGEGDTYQVDVLAPQHGALRTDPFLLPGGTIRSLTGESRLAVSPIQTQVTGRVLEADGHGVGGAEVLLERQGVGVIATVKAQPDGTFHITGVHVQPGARYRLRVIALDGARTGAVTDWVELTPGRPWEVTLQFKRGSGDMYDEGNIRVAVVDPAGRPVEGAVVELFREGYGKIREGTTDALGHRLFTRVEGNQAPASSWWAPKGNGFVVRIRKPGYYDLVVGEPTLDVTKEQETVVNAVLYPVSAPVSGQVTDPDGRPVAGAKVVLLPEGGGLSLETTTDDLGAFRFPEVSTGRRWTLTVQAEGYWPGMGPEAIALDPAQGAVVNVTLRPMGATLTGRVAGDGGRSVAGGLVVVAPDGRRFSARTQSAGWYELKGLPPGVPLTLAVDAGEEAAAPAAPAEPAAPEAAVVGLTPDLQPVGPVVLQPGERRTLDLARPSGTGTVAGTVMDLQGQPLPGVWLQLVREGAGVVATAQTDFQGRYQFADVPANPAGGRYLVRVAAPAAGYRQAGSLGLPALFRVMPGQVTYQHLVVVPR